MTTELTSAQAVEISGESIAEAIRALRVSHVVCVPDTNLRTTISALADGGGPEFVYACTEDEAIGINAGLYITGKRPMLLIQNNGLYACINTLKAMPLDAKIPTFMLIGQFGRDVTQTIESNPKRAVHRLEPTLQTWGVPFFRLETPVDLPNIQRAWDVAWDNPGPAAAIVGAPTN